MDADGNPTNLRHCTVPGCRRPFYARQVCQHHYLLDYRGLPRRGRPGPPMTVRSGPSYVRGGRGV